MRDVSGLTDGEPLTPLSETIWKVESTSSKVSSSVNNEIPILDPEVSECLGSRWLCCRSHFSFPTSTSINMLNVIFSHYGSSSWVVGAIVTRVNDWVT